MALTWTWVAEYLILKYRFWGWEIQALVCKNCVWELEFSLSQKELQWMSCPQLLLHTLLAHLCILGGWFWGRPTSPCLCCLCPPIPTLWDRIGQVQFGLAVGSPKPLWQCFSVLRVRVWSSTRGCDFHSRFCEIENYCYIWNSSFCEGRELEPGFAVRLLILPKPWISYPKTSPFPATSFCMCTYFLGFEYVYVWDVNNISAQIVTMTNLFSVFE